jgi:hypothetical protein
MKIINLWGGPGTGKSTTAADLFAHMKWKNINVELVNEYAKEVTWDERFKILEDQLYIMAKQNHKLWRLKGKVDWVITDSPLAMALVYAGEDYLPNHFGHLGHEIFNHYDNINIFLKREKPYHKIGRNQNESEARVLDARIKSLLIDHKYDFIEVAANQDAKSVIFDYIENML